jgi:hypothetical protein
MMALLDKAAFAARALALQGHNLFRKLKTAFREQLFAAGEPQPDREVTARTNSA